jgi:hypothetical protein
MRGVVTWLMLRPTQLGARLSAWNNRFPIRIYGEAIKEAQSLTREKVKL